VEKDRLVSIQRPIKRYVYRFYYLMIAAANIFSKQIHILVPHIHCGQQSYILETQRKLIKWFRNSTFIAFFMIWYVMKGGTVSSIYFLFCVNSLFINMFDTIHSYINFCICMYMYMYIWLLATVNVWYKNMDLFRKNIRCCYHKIIKSVNVAFYRSLDRKNRLLTQNRK
jgi:hypothetical protein